MILVTGSAGQVGATLIRHLRAAGHDVLGSDIETSSDLDAISCDLRLEEDVHRLFADRQFDVVVHLAAVLPTAFRSDPLIGGEVNLSATIRLLKAAVHSRVRRFVFGSSASVYGNAERRLCTETADPMPDEPYGASKLAVEKILEHVPNTYAIEAVSLRIVRVLGVGAKNSDSPWRSQMFERPMQGSNPLTVPFAPDAKLSVIHVQDLARALQALIESPMVRHRIYNAPAEVVTANEIRRLAGLRGWEVRLGTSRGGPEICGTRFMEDFGFTMRPLEEYLAE